MSKDNVTLLLPLLPIIIGLIGALVQLRIANKNPPQNIAHEPPAAIFWRTVIYSVVVSVFISVITIAMTLSNLQTEMKRSSVALGNIDTLATFSSLLQATEDSGEISPFLEKLLIKKQRSFQKSVEEAISGRIYLGSEEIDTAALGLISSSSSSIKATSYVSPEAWWGTAWGRKYMSDNADAVKRGVRVERTFIFNDANELKKWESVLKANHDAGVIVRYEFASNLSLPFARDVINIDNKFVGVLELENRKIRSVYFSHDSDEIRKVNEILQLLGSATIYKP